MIVADRSVRMNIMLHTAAGPVRPVNLFEVLVIDEDEDGLILGEDILGELGISIDRQLNQLARQSQENDDPTATTVDFWVGSVPNEGVKQAVDDMIAKTIKYGFPAEKEERLRTIVNMQYPPRLSKFLKAFNEELVRLGWVYENSASRWACPALPVKKPGKDEYRQTNDYRPINGMTDPIADVMPLVQVIMEDVRDMVFFGLFDFIKGFWQLSLAKANQKILSYMTDAKLPVTFTDEEQSAFRKVKACLASSAMLAHPSQIGVLSVFTDASDVGWSIIVTDVEAWQDSKPIAEQQHRLLQWLSGTFTGSLENWSVIEKGAFAIVAACDKLPHLRLRPAGFRLHCDHRNLIHVFDPDETVKKHIRGKLLR
ncbi:unnamed protein product [Phytophthora fragariaefolia]|uniref:Unnamed protein product n=1 Tax=Phytophthora fragariaefolia TaxID=1490495 RepID=A0A9W7CYR0_9STRA|nr:unnamed protein product [Phytophthora fragariaefolia]